MNSRDFMLLMLLVVIVLQNLGYPCLNIKRFDVPV
jgi:hypothetical protein